MSCEGKPNKEYEPNLRFLLRKTGVSRNTNCHEILVTITFTHSYPMAWHDVVQSLHLNNYLPHEVHPIFWDSSVFSIGNESRLFCCRTAVKAFN